MIHLGSAKKNPVGRPAKKNPVGRPAKKNPVGRPVKKKLGRPIKATIRPEIAASPLLQAVQDLVQLLFETGI